MFSFARTNLKNVAYQFRKIVPGHYKDVMFHLRDNCHYQNPLNKEFCKCLKTGGNIFVEHFAYKTLSDNLSFMIFNENKKIVGVILNGISRPEDFNEYSNAIKQIDETNFCNMLQKICQQKKENDIFEQFNIFKAFDIRLISVDRNYNTRCLAKYLIQMSELLAKNQKFKIIKADTFGEFPQKHLKRCGFQCLSEKKIYFNNFDETLQLEKKILETKLHLLYKKLDI